MYASIESIKCDTSLARFMSLVGNVTGGFMVSFSVLAVIAIADGLSSYVFDGATISEKINARVGGQ